MVFGTIAVLDLRMLGIASTRRPVSRIAMDVETWAWMAFVLTAAGLREPPGQVDSSMRLCVSARLSDQDEIRSYRRWRQDKGGR